MANAGTLEFDIRSNYKDALDGLDKVGKKLEKFGRDVIELTGVMTAFGGVMVNEAAKYDKTVATAVDHMKGSYASLSVVIGKTLAPAVEEAAQFVADLTATIESMDAPTKEAAANAFKLAAEIAAAAAAISLVGKVGGLLADLGGVIASLATPWGAVAAGAMAAAAAVIYYKGAMDELGRPGAYAGYHTKQGALEELKKQENVRGELGRGLSSAEKAAGLLGRPEDIAEVQRFKSTIAETDARIAELNDALSKPPKSLWDRTTDTLSTGFKKLLADLGMELPSLVSGAVGKGPKPLSDAAKTQADIAKEDEQVYKDLAKLLDDNRKARQKLIDAIRKDKVMDPFGKKNRLDPTAPPPPREPTEELETFADTLNRASDRLMGMVGSFGQAASHMKGLIKTIQEGDSGGIWEMIINIVLDFIQGTKGFGKWIDLLDQQMAKISSMLEPVMPIIIALTDLATPILDAVGTLLDVIFDLLPVLKVLSAVISFTSVTIKNTIGIIEVAIGNLFSFVGKLLNNSWLIDTGAELILRGSATLMEAAAEFMSIPRIFDSVADSGDSAAAALDKFTESLTNVPTGFRVEAARFGATDIGPVHGASPHPGGSSGGAAPGTGGTPPSGVPGGSGGWADSGGLPPAPPIRNAPIVEVTLEGDLAPLIQRVAVRQRQEAARERSNRDGRYRNTWSDAGGAY